MSTPNIDLARLDCLAYAILTARRGDRTPLVNKRAAVNLSNWWGTPTYDVHAPRHLGGVR